MARCEILSLSNKCLQEQRTHIDVLDSALSNAQTTVLRLEEELRQKDILVERVKQMTKSLEQLQAASETREASEAGLRAKLEEEVRELRAARDSGALDRTETEADMEQLADSLSQAEQKVSTGYLDNTMRSSNPVFLFNFALVFAINLAEPPMCNENE